MLKRRLLPCVNSERGDTIVEVLVAIAVISLIVGGAYVTTNKSLVATRGAQERGNAIKLSEAQLEQLKGVISKTPSDIFGGAAPTPFCIYNNVATGALDVVAASDPKCKVNAAGTPTTAEPSFQLSIDHPAANDFTVKNSWTDASGKATDYMQIKYRAYQ